MSYVGPERTQRWQHRSVTTRRSLVRCPARGLFRSSVRCCSERNSGGPARFLEMPAASMDSYYDALELGRTADTDEIKKSFRKLSLKYHPERAAGPKAESEVRFSRLQRRMMCCRVTATKHR